MYCLLLVKILLEARVDATVVDDDRDDRKVVPTSGNLEINMNGGGTTKGINYKGIATKGITIHKMYRQQIVLI